MFEVTIHPILAATVSAAHLAISESQQEIWKAIKRLIAKPSVS